MSRTVICRKYQQELPGLDNPPMPGDIGQDIFENVSAKAWKEWEHLQTMLINEKHLSLRDPLARKYLNTQRQKFLTNDSYEKPAGYSPPESEE